MRVLAKRVPEYMIWFMAFSALALWNSTAFFIAAGIMSGLMLLYLIMAATVLPTMQQTLPKYFANSGKISKVQIITCVGYLAAIWSAVLWRVV